MSIAGDGTDTIAAGRAALAVRRTNPTASAFPFADQKIPMACYDAIDRRRRTKNRVPPRKASAAEPGSGTTVSEGALAAPLLSTSAKPMSPLGVASWISTPLLGREPSCHDLT